MGMFKKVITSTSASVVVNAQQNTGPETARVAAATLPRDSIVGPTAQIMPDGVVTASLNQPLKKSEGGANTPPTIRMLPPTSKNNSSHTFTDDDAHIYKDSDGDYDGDDPVKKQKKSASNRDTTNQTYDNSEDLPPDASITTLPPLDEASAKQRQPPHTPTGGHLPTYLVPSAQAARHGPESSGDNESDSGSAVTSQQAPNEGIMIPNDSMTRTDSVSTRAGEQARQMDNPMNSAGTRDTTAHQIETSGKGGKNPKLPDAKPEEKPTLLIQEDLMDALDATAKKKITKEGKVENINWLRRLFSRSITRYKENISNTLDLGISRLTGANNADELQRIRSNPKRAFGQISELRRHLGTYSKEDSQEVKGMQTKLNFLGLLVDFATLAHPSNPTALAEMQKNAASLTLEDVKKATGFTEQKILQSIENTVLLIKNDSQNDDLIFDILSAMDPVFAEKVVRHISSNKSNDSISDFVKAPSGSASQADESIKKIEEKRESKLTNSPKQFAAELIMRPKDATKQLLKMDPKTKAMIVDNIDFSKLYAICGSSKKFGDTAKEMGIPLHNAAAYLAQKKYANMESASLGEILSKDCAAYGSASTSDKEMLGIFRMYAKSNTMFTRNAKSQEEKAIKAIEKSKSQHSVQRLSDGELRGMLILMQAKPGSSVPNLVIDKFKSSTPEQAASMLMIATRENQAAILLTLADDGKKVQILTAMPPRQAASLSATLENNKIADLLTKMNPENAAKILTEMSKQHPEIVPKIIPEIKIPAFLEKVGHQLKEQAILENGINKLNLIALSGIALLRAVDLTQAEDKKSELSKLVKEAFASAQKVFSEKGDKIFLSTEVTSLVKAQVALNCYKLSQSQGEVKLGQSMMSVLSKIITAGELTDISIEVENTLSNAKLHADRTFVTAIRQRSRGYHASSAISFRDAGNLYFMAGRTDEARIAYVSAKKLFAQSNNEFEHLCAQAKVSELDGNIKEAIAHLNQAKTKVNEDSAEFFITEAEVYRLVDNHNSAYDSLMKAAAATTTGTSHQLELKALLMSTRCQGINEDQKNRAMDAIIRALVQNGALIPEILYSNYTAVVDKRGSIISVFLDYITDNKEIINNRDHQTLLNTARGIMNVSGLADKMGPNEAFSHRDSSNNELRGEKLKSMFAKWLESHQDKSLADFLDQPVTPDLFKEGLSVPEQIYSLTLSMVAVNQPDALLLMQAHKTELLAVFDRFYDVYLMSALKDRPIQSIVDALEPMDPRNARIVVNLFDPKKAASILLKMNGVERNKVFDVLLKDPKFNLEAFDGENDAQQEVDPWLKNCVLHMAVKFMKNRDVKFSFEDNDPNKLIFEGSFILLNEEQKANLKKTLQVKGNYSRSSMGYFCQDLVDHKGNLDSRIGPHAEELRANIFDNDKWSPIQVQYFHQWRSYMWQYAETLTSLHKEEIFADSDIDFEANLAKVRTSIGNWIRTDPDYIKRILKMTKEKMCKNNIVISDQDANAVNDLIFKMAESL